MSFLRAMRRRLCLGFYCVGIVTALVLLSLYSLLCVEREADRIRRHALVRKRYLPPQLHLPTQILYNQGTAEFVKKEKNTAFYKKSLEEDILSLAWVRELREILTQANKTTPFSPQVNLVVADWRHVELLLNWLIVAMVRLSPPLRNVVVLGISEEICETLKPRGFSCVFADPSSFMRTSYVNQFVKFLPVYTAPQTRLLAARLVNLWGYSFASYDTDALVLKNPQEVFDQYGEVDVVAGAGMHWPLWANGLWGFSMCLGAFMIRSGPRTEELWKAVSRSWGEWGSEQDQFNRALANMINWNETSPNMTSSEFCQHSSGWLGYSAQAPNLSILLLPPSQFCRGECCKTTTTKATTATTTHIHVSHDLYVSHGGGGNIGRFSGKVNHLKTQGVWFLRDDWLVISGTTVATGRQWLKQLSTI